MYKKTGHGHDGILKLICSAFFSFVKKKRKKNISSIRMLTYSTSSTSNIDFAILWKHFPRTTMHFLLLKCKITKMRVHTLQRCKFWHCLFFQSLCRSGNVLWKGCWCKSFLINQNLTESWRAVSIPYVALFLNFSSQSSEEMKSCRKISFHLLWFTHKVPISNVHTWWNKLLLSTSYQRSKVTQSSLHPIFIERKPHSFYETKLPVCRLQSRGKYICTKCLQLLPKNTFDGYLRIFNSFTRADTIKQEIFIKLGNILICHF